MTLKLTLTRHAPSCSVRSYRTLNGRAKRTFGKLEMSAKCLPTAVRETEALWRALINLVPEPADAPERQSFELLRNDCPCEQRD